MSNEFRDAADASHTRSDVYASVALIVGLGLVAAGYPRADGIFTLLIAFVIAHRIADAVERRVAAELSAREVVAHVEPTRPVS